MPELSATHAAQVMGVNRRTVIRWCEAGLVKARQVTRRRDYRADVDDLRKLAQQYGYDFDEELAEKLAR